MNAPLFKFSNASRPIAGVSRIAVIGNAMPRQCGLATFTSHCVDALRSAFPALTVDHYAMNDGDDDVRYDDSVHLIAADSRIDYSRAARDIVDSEAQAIWLQHEFGIFGGSAGEYIVQLLDRARLPLLVTLHTVLEHPSADEERVLRAIIKRADALMVMARRARDILIERYDVEPGRIVVIPHGVPVRPLVASDTMKQRFGLAGRQVALTFGLLAPDKGIEHMIRALPSLVESHPDLVYVVLGATHPHLRRREGEALRERLAELAAELGVADHLIKVDEFVDQDTLLDWLQAADIYVTPYINPAQVTSGALSYAVAMGNPVVSTPYVHASELITPRIGTIVPFADSDALADAIGALLDSPERRHEMACAAHETGRNMAWDVLATKVVDRIAQAIKHRPVQLTPRPAPVPADITMDAIVGMSDDVGMFQHSVFAVPDRNHGYCIDDNARAMMLVAGADGLHPKLRNAWLRTYAAFVQHGWNPDLERFRNFMRYDRSWCEDEGSEDSSGRTIWALGCVARDATDTGFAQWAKCLLGHSIEPIAALKSPRTNAFVMLGASALIQAEPGDRIARDTLSRLGDQLVRCLTDHRQPGWTWFESVLAYDNCRKPEALLRAGRLLGRTDFVDAGLESLEWIVEQQTAPQGHFRGVGNESFGRAHAVPLVFDQQPLEATATIDACEAAFAVTRDERWVEAADAAWQWFHGANDLGVAIGDLRTGDCFDGLTPSGPNQNRGAESLLALQMASATMRRLQAAAPDLPLLRFAAKQRVS